VPLSQLAVNRLESSASKEDKKTARKGRVKRTKFNSQLEALARQVQLFNNVTASDKESHHVLKIEESAEGAAQGEDADPSKKKKQYMYHNIEANPDQFDKVADLLKLIAHWFYDDEVALLLSCFLEQKLYRESDLSKQLLLPQKQIGSILTRLLNHQMLIRTICEQKGVTASARTFNTWMLDLDVIMDVIRYRLLMMIIGLNNELRELKDQILSCPTCQVKFRSIDIDSLLDSRHPNGYACKYCKSALEHIDNTLKIENNKRLLVLVEKELQPLHEQLNELLQTQSHVPAVTSDANQTASDDKTRKQPLARPGTARTGPAKSGKKTGLLIEPGAVLSAGTAGTTPAATTLTRTSAEEITVEEDEIKTPFNPQPVIFGLECDLYLQVITELNDFNLQRGFQLAKELLDAVGDFETIVSIKAFKYVMTKHSLYVAYKKGYRAHQIIRLLRVLAQNPMPTNLLQLILREEEYINYYKAVMVLRDNKYYIQSTDKQVLLHLLSHPPIRALAIQPDQIYQLTLNGNELHYSFEVHEHQPEQIKKYCAQFGYPVVDEFDFATHTGETISIDLKRTTRVRDYQTISGFKLFWPIMSSRAGSLADTADEAKNSSDVALVPTGRLGCHSGVLVLPCGAGKTLVGITVTSALKKPTIIFCQSILSVNQWKEQYLRWTTLPSDKHVSRFTSDYSHEWNPRAPIIITTYGMFNTSSRRSESALNMISKCKTREWGLLILDEVHLAPANNIRQVTNSIRCHVKLGLTATMVREDSLITDLPNLVGPKIFELDIFTLRMRGHIAYVQCLEMHVPLTPEFNQAYYSASGLEEKRLMYATNPNKTRVCHTLIKQHLEKNHKIMVFCDNLFGLEWYTHMLRKPKIDGDTPNEERQKILENFRTTKGGDCVLFSRVGDHSIDLPEADVVIQVALMDGSRMQEGQRIGRVQRPQERKLRAYFYSLITANTEEIDYAAKRRSFLTEHGYTVDVTREYLKYITADTEHITSYKIQAELLDAIQNELTRRIEKRDEKERLKFGGDLLAGETEANSKKRKKSTISVRNSIRKKLQKTREATLSVWWSWMSG
jgi:DNA excision repair protein ERCC-3